MLFIHILHSLILIRNVHVKMSKCLFFNNCAMNLNAISSCTCNKGIKVHTIV